MIADRQFQDCEPITGLNALPQLLEPEGKNHADTVGRMTLPTRQGESGISHKIGESIAFMVQHVNQPLQVSTLATMASISPSHFFALFKRYTGRAPMDYFTRLRMERARRLLDTTNSSVKEVAAALGYDDPFYFSRVFKSVHGVAPSEYRSRQAEAGKRNHRQTHSIEKNSAACMPPQPLDAPRAREDLSRGPFPISSALPQFVPQH